MVGEVGGGGAGGETQTENRREAGHGGGGGGREGVVGGGSEAGETQTADKKTGEKLGKRGWGSRREEGGRGEHSECRQEDRREVGQDREEKRGGGG